MSSLINRSPVKFYGQNTLSVAENLKEKASKAPRVIEKYFPKNLIEGPVLTVKTFFKQEDALNFEKRYNRGLMTFAYETDQPGRLFLVAHPIVLWHYNSQRAPNERCTYEIIKENTVCKIYLDLEYDKSVNPNSNGEEMVESFIKIICYYLRKYFKVDCDRRFILDMDSSTMTKFSRHIIFNLPSSAFINNRNVGNFIKQICQDLREINSTNAIPNDFNVTLDNVKNLFVNDGKSSSRLFCDESVYTKNRHFRCYQNTKKGKNAPLVLSDKNEYFCNNDHEYFLSSLVTRVEGDKAILEFDTTTNNKSPRRVKLDNIKTESTPSPYPIIDNFIIQLIKPGKIYRSVFFSSTSALNYDIVGNRFCGNINRQHKSNNIKYVVDLNTCCYYQKCHDWECRDYKSEKMHLPEEIAKEFKIVENEKDSIEFSESEIAESMMAQVAEQIESTYYGNQQKKAKLEKFPSFGLHDEDFLNINSQES